MSGFANPFARDGADDFVAFDAFDPGTLPEPGPFLEGHRVLAGDEHSAFHRLTRDLFEARGVYDATFGYNLARLSLDRRHPDAGFRYAVEEERAVGERAVGEQASGEGALPRPDTDAPVLRAEFTPTTPFCPQSTALTLGAFRAWNGLAERHEYGLVRVRIAAMHHASDDINDRLARLEREFVATGTVPQGGTGGYDPALATEHVDDADRDVPGSDLPF